jgi:hypothetical protein
MPSLEKPEKWVVEKRASSTFGDATFLSYYLEQHDERFETVTYVWRAGQLSLGTIKMTSEVYLPSDSPGRFCTDSTSSIYATCAALSSRTSTVPSWRIFSDNLQSMADCLVHTSLNDAEFHSAKSEPDSQLSFNYDWSSTTRLMMASQRIKRISQTHIVCYESESWPVLPKEAMDPPQPELFNN